jgi:nucleotide-binding universal stress UspA family protein
MGSAVRDRILFAVDGSGHSLQAVRYASSILDPQRFEVVLLHILTRVPESFIDLEKMPAYKYRLVNVDAWEQQHQNVIQGFMEKARAILSEAGFAESAITVRVDERNVGIARDIAAESRNGYKAVVVGRKGMSELKDFMLGSIANKILELVSIPLWVISGTTLPTKILVCMDSSEGAMAALNHLTQILDGWGKCQVTLFHAVRSFSGFRKFMHDVFTSENDKKKIDKLEQEFRVAAGLLEPAFDKAQANLITAGIDDSRISRKIVSGAANSANAIIEEAEKGGYDTIVVGRRGISHTEEFLMGRVSSKTIHLAKDKTVWVVN